MHGEHFWIVSEYAFCLNLQGIGRMLLYVCLSTSCSLTDTKEMVPLVSDSGIGAFPALRTVTVPKYKHWWRSQDALCQDIFSE